MARHRWPVLHVRLLVILSALALGAIGAPGAPAAQRMSPVTELPLEPIPIPALASQTPAMDIFEIDQTGHRLYVGDRALQGVDVFDVSTPQAQFVRTIPTGSGANGVSVAADLHKLFAALDDSTVVVIDVDPASPSFDTIVARIATGGERRADELDYDPVHQKIYVANSDEGFVTVVDARTNTILTRIDGLGDRLEQPRYNAADGMVYLTTSGDNALYEFNPATDELVTVHEIGDRCQPNGLAINPTANQAILGCSSRAGYPHLALWDFGEQRVVATFLQASTGDQALYDASVNRYLFASQDSPNGPQITVLSGDPVAFLTNVRTTPGTKNVAFDTSNHMVYTQNFTPGQAGIVGFRLPES